MVFVNLLICRPTVLAALGQISSNSLEEWRIKDYIRFLIPAFQSQPRNLQRKQVAEHDCVACTDKNV